MSSLLKERGVSFNNLLRVIKEYDDVQEGSNDILKKYFSAQSLFENSYIEKIKDKTDEICKGLEKMNIHVLAKEEFKNFKSLSNIKDANWFFIKGNLEILKRNQDEFVSIVGSRKTPTSYIKWIENNVPKKTIVSGLANGADVYGHEWAMKNNLDIVVFPGTDLAKAPKTGIKNKIWEYAIKKGVIISDVFPGISFFDKNGFLRRNKWMAQMSDSSFVLYFEKLSGTLSQLKETSILNKDIFLPKVVFDKNEAFLRANKNFNSIIEHMNVKGDI